MGQMRAGKGSREPHPQPTPGPLSKWPTLQ